MPTCKELGIPKRLWKRGESDNNIFNDGNELLYRWVRPGVNFTPDGKVSDTSFDDVFDPPSNISCNRSSMCKYPTDVLYNTEKLYAHRNSFGIIEAKVKNVNNHVFQCEFQSDKGTQIVSITLLLKHDPIECMYPHTIIQCYQEDMLLGDKVKPKTLRKAIRLGLAPLFDLHRYPDPKFTFPIETKWEVILTTIEQTLRRFFSYK